jgi:methionyl-tRNA formyltransferase
MKRAELDGGGAVRVVFMGTPAFAVPSLDALLTSSDVVCVYARPDGRAGRGQRVTAPAVKQRAIDVGVRVEQPVSLRDPLAIDALRALAPDLIVVAAYGTILPPEIIDMPALGCVNVHASLLPRWRGAAPVQRAILAGDELAGVSIMRMEEGLDTGPWCVRVSTPVDGKTAAELTSELSLLGAGALMAALPCIVAGECTWTPQVDADATYAAKVTPADVALEPALPVVDAWRRVRSSGPSAACRALIGDRRVTIVTAEPIDRSVAPGHVLTDDGLVLGFADGALRVDALVPEGRSAMAAADWLRGARLTSDTSWSRS